MSARVRVVQSEPPLLGPARSRSGSGRARRLVHEAPVVLDDFAVCEDPPTTAQSADQVPVQGALALAARLRIRAAKRQM